MFFRTKKVYITNVGCGRRSMDALKWEKYCAEKGFKRVQNPEKADFLIVFTCGSNQAMEDKSIKVIENLRKYKGELIVGGCISGTNPKKLAKVFQGKSFTPKDKNPIKIIFGEKAADIDTKEDVSELFLEKKLSYTPENNVSYIRISEGCSGFCSYCNIKNAIGEVRSKPVEVILKEIKKCVSRGIYRFTLMSSDSGSYGIDMGHTLPGLLTTILDVDERIIIDSIQDFSPKWLIEFLDVLLPLFKSNRVRGMLLPVQSGNTRILGLMRRAVDPQKIKEACSKIKGVNKNFRIETQIIVGFPSETEAEFQETLLFIKEMFPYRVDIFKYSETDTTPAYMFPGKIDAQTIERRAKEAYGYCMREDINFTYDIITTNKW